MTSIRYKRGYKYQLYHDYTVPVPILPRVTIETRFLVLMPCGVLLIRAGYAWDGPSGPAIDTRNFMRGSLVHDALYELIRGGHLDRATCKPIADCLLRDICRADGMSRVRAWWVYRAVDWFGGRATRRERKVFAAPRGQRKRRKRNE